MTDPAFWATIAGAAVQLPAAIKSLRRLVGKAGASSTDADAAYESVRVHVRQLGSGIDYMRAWKKVHDALDTILHGYADIYADVRKYGKHNAVAFAAAVRDPWETYRTTALPRFFGALSTGELEIAGTVDMNGDQGVDWLALLKQKAEQAGTNLEKDKCAQFWEDLRDLEYYLTQLLTIADRQLIDAIDAFSSQWLRMEEGLQHE